MKKDIKSILNELAKEVLWCVKSNLQYFALEDSRMANGMSVETNGVDLISILAADYAKYIISGRKRGAKFPPMEAIAEWCVRKGIPSDNSTVFLICRAISRRGIQPRDFISASMDDIETMVDMFFENLADEWMKEIEGAI